MRRIHSMSIKFWEDQTVSVQHGSALSSRAAWAVDAGAISSTTDGVNSTISESGAVHSSLGFSYLTNRAKESGATKSAPATTWNYSIREVESVIQDDFLLWVTLDKCEWVKKERHKYFWERIVVRIIFLSLLVSIILSGARLDTEW